MRSILIISIFLIFTQWLQGQISLDAKDPKCYGENSGSITVSVKNAALPIKSYSWNDGNGLEKRTKLAAGSYCVTVTDNNDCTASKCVVLKEPSSALSISTRLTADDETVPCGMVKPVWIIAEASGGNGPYNMNGKTGPVFTRRVTRPEWVYFSLADKNGCTKDFKEFVHPGLVACSSDPNDIQGNPGIDQERWVSNRDTLQYKIRFENDSLLATAPAQKIVVETSIHPDAEIRSFRLGNFGFRNLSFQVPDNVSFYSTRLDLRPEIQLFVDVTAGVNVQDNKAFWIMQSIDPLTGLPPLNPFSGHLPINNAAGDGEGYFQFRIRPKNTVQTRDSISFQADIKFDLENNILTNIWTNTIDALPPQTTVNTVADTLDQSSFFLSWSSSDDSDGCGVESFTIWYSTDSINYLAYISQYPEDTLTIFLPRGNTYYFKVEGRDKVGNTEKKVNHDLKIHLLPLKSLRFMDDHAMEVCFGNIVHFNLESVRISHFDFIVRKDSIDEDIVFFENLSSDSFPLSVLFPDSLISDSLTLIVRSHQESIYADTILNFRVLDSPVVIASKDTSTCVNELVPVSATGANTYDWYNSSGYYTSGGFVGIGAQISGYFHVVGTSINGCTSQDSLYLSVLPVFRDTVLIGLCQGDSILIGNDWVDTIGLFPVVYSSQMNCDSLIIYEVFFENPCIWPNGNIVYIDKDAAGNNTGINWFHAFNELQDGIRIAGRYANVSEIWVAEGEYKPHLTRRDTSFVLKDSIKIYGGFTGTETDREQRSTDASLVQLSGDINLADTLWDNSFHTVIISESCVNCIMDGLTVRFGFADSEQFPDDVGAGILGRGMATFKNIIIEMNNADGEGAAIHSSGLGSVLTIEGCIFRFNYSAFGGTVVNTDGGTVNFKGINQIK